jgi:hypothetical protein
LRRSSAADNESPAVDACGCQQLVA